MKHIRITFLLFTVFALALTACGGAASTPAAATEAPAATEMPAATQAPAADIALKITGSVANEQAWTEDEVKAMNSMDVESVNNKGEKSTYTGVLLSDLLAEAGPNSDANVVTFVASDGSTAETSIYDVKACTDCVASFRNNGGFSIVMPYFPADLQVKGVVEEMVREDMQWAERDALVQTAGFRTFS